MVSGLSGASGISGLTGFYNPGSAGAIHQWAARLQPGLSNNDSLSQFNDAVGTLSPTATGTGLLYLTNQINGLPAISFESVTQAFLGGGIGITGNPDTTVIAVASSVSSSTARRILQFGASAAGGGTVKSYALNDPGFRFNNASRIFNPPSNAAGWHIFVGFNASGATVADHRMLADGTELTQASISSGGSTPNVANEETIIGAGRNSGGATPSNYFNGKLAELVVLTTISTHVINYHGRQLARIYNLTWTDFAG